MVIKMLKPILIFLSLIIVILFSVNASTTLEKDAISGSGYFVAKNGNDNNIGTEGHPWLTISKAANTARAGDTVYIKAGTYYEKVNIMNSGSEGNYITFAAFPGETVNIDGSYTSQDIYEGLINIKGNSYIIIKGFNFKNALAQGAGVRVNNNANHIAIRNNTFISAFGGSPIKIGWQHTTDILIENNIIDRKNSPTCNSMSGACWVEAISVSNSDGVTIRNNQIRYNQVGEGIDFKDGTKNGKIYGNIVKNTSSVGIYIDARGDMRNFEIHDNIVSVFFDAIALANEEDGSDYDGIANIENVSIYNNIAYNSKMGIRIAPWGWLGDTGTIKDVRIINNIFYNNVDGNDVGFYSQTYVENLIIRNNIFNKNGLNVYRGTVTADHNMFDTSRDCYGSFCTIGDPKFINPTNADFHIQNASPADSIFRQFLK